MFIECNKWCWRSKRVIWSEKSKTLFYFIFAQSLYAIKSTVCLYFLAADFNVFLRKRDHMVELSSQVWNSQHLKLYSYFITEYNLKSFETKSGIDLARWQIAQASWRRQRLKLLNLISSYIKPSHLNKRGIGVCLSGVGHCFYSLFSALVQSLV